MSQRGLSERAGAAPAEAGSCGVLLFQLSRASGEGLAGALAGLGMRKAEFVILYQLGDAGPLSQRALARALRIHPSNLVALLDALEAERLLVRRRDSGDRRRYLVELTGEGRRRLLAAERAALAAERELLSPLSPAERRRLRELLGRLAGHSCAPAGTGCGGT